MPEIHRPYPLFVPPDGLSEGVPWEWTRAQATAYSEWLQGCLEARSEAVVARFGLDPSAPTAENLAPLGKLVAEALAAEPFSMDGKPTPQGFALAADMGLLLARALLEQHPHLEWTVVRRPKADVSYNQPVLSGFGPLGFDPVRMGVTQAWGVLDGTWDHTAWAKVFEIWSERASTDQR